MDGGGLLPRSAAGRRCFVGRLLGLHFRLWPVCVAHAVVALPWPVSLDGMVVLLRRRRRGHWFAGLRLCAPVRAEGARRGVFYGCAPGGLPHYAFAASFVLPGDFPAFCAFFFCRVVCCWLLLRANRDCSCLLCMFPPVLLLACSARGWFWRLFFSLCRLSYPFFGFPCVHLLLSLGACLLHRIF